MNLLILGGTKFLGRHLVEAALTRNHRVTLFNRGRTNSGLFPEVEKLQGDREGNLETLRGRRWDGAIDTCGFVSGEVRAAAGLLADSIGHYTFISSISVYRDLDIPGQDERAEVQAHATDIEDRNDSESYGARKALCERAAEAVMPGRVLSIRAGLIVGPHDPTGRFWYWVNRTARGGEVLAPGDPNAPVQLIDVRDLAGWIIRMIEWTKTGVYNATGPAGVLTFEQMLEQCREAADSDARFTWVPEQFLMEHNVAPFQDLPLWLPRKHHGFFMVDCRRAFADGLTCRKVVDTARDTLTWKQSRLTTAGSEPLDASDGIRLKSDRERELLQAWKNLSPTGPPPAAISLS